MPSTQRRLRARTLFLAGGAVTATVAIAFVAISGLLRLEAHGGFFAPAWSADGHSVYFLERRTRGISWGLGWEFFTPPAWARVFSDVMSLNVLDVESGNVHALAEVTGSPLLGRTTRNYRGRIFNIFSAGINATQPVLRFNARLTIPVVPRSEHWHVAGSWPQEEGVALAWSRAWSPQPSLSEPVLREGRELIVSDGPEGYPRAILSVAADGSHDVLLRSDDFSDHYPQGMSRQWLVERSRREQILRVRDFNATHAALVKAFRSQGMSENESSLAAYDRMKQTGHLPPDPTVVATVVATVPDGEPTFVIPASYFDAGLFRDIAAAIVTPGKAVQTGTGDYLQYYDDDVGVRLREFRKRRDAFHVQIDGTLYLLVVKRPE